jgi:hypothetical protein
MSKKFDQGVSRNIRTDQSVYEFIKGQKIGKKRGFITWATKEPKTVKTQNTNQKNPLPTLVNRGFAIHQQLLVLNEEFKQIKERLKAEAETRLEEHIPLLDKESLGQQWLVLGDGCECRVVFPADQLKTEFDAVDPLLRKVKNLSGDHFKTLFRRVTTFEARDKKAFRGQVSALLKTKKAGKLLAFCSSPTEPKTLWKARAAGKEKP